MFQVDLFEFLTDDKLNMIMKKIHTKDLSSPTKGERGKKKMEKIHTKDLSSLTK